MMNRKIFLLSGVSCLVSYRAAEAQNVHYSPIRYFQDAIVSGVARIECNEIETKDLKRLFDSEPRSLIRSNSRNPVRVRIEFPEPVKVEYVRVTLSYGNYLWAVYSADNISDLEKETGSFQRIINASKGGSDHNSKDFGQKVLPGAITARAFQLTVRKVGGDNVVHINEWQLCREAQIADVEIIPVLRGAKQIFPGWQVPLRSEIVLDDGARAQSPVSKHKIISENPEVASVRDDVLYAKSPGEAMLSTIDRGRTVKKVITISRPLLEPTQIQVPDLERPVEGYLWEVPFVVVAFIPTEDGKTVNRELTNWQSSIEDLQTRIIKSQRNLKWMLEEASRFRGYKNPLAKPSIGCRLVRFFLFFEDVPRSPRDGEGISSPDYEQIINRINGKSLVEDDGVKEFWIHHWHHKDVSPIESNMASPLTGDISNSYRAKDLPVYRSTYTVYGGNFTRGPGLHTYGHQMEAILSFINKRQDGNDNLFWEQFCGSDRNRKFQTGRCGNCHYPPNGTRDYDYQNKNAVLSDAEDWNPVGTGQRTSISCDRWNSIPYRSPTDDTLRGRNTILEPDAWWYIYWFQNFPGRDNAIPHPRGEMTNWWRFTGDWDGAIREKYGLWKP